MKIFAFCKPYLLSRKYTLFVYIVLTLLSSAIGIISPYIVGAFLDGLVAGGDKSIILYFSIIYGGLSIFKILKDYATSVIYTKMQVKMGFDLNITVIKHIQTLSLSFINQKDGMYLNQRLNGDSYHLITFCLSILQNVITNVILFVVPFAILLLINWFITVLMISFILIYIILYLALKEWIYKTGYIFRESQAKFFSKLYEQLKYIKLIKTNSIQSEINKRAEDSFTDFMATAICSQKANVVYMGLDSVIATLAKVAIFVVGGLQILNGSFTVGMFTIFSSYFSMMFDTSRYFFGLGATYQNAMASYNRVVEILECSSEVNGKKSLVNIEKIELSDVNFHYNVNLENNSIDDCRLKHDKEHIEEELENGELALKVKNVINSFSAEFLKGNIYALVGKNGAGKSTLINLIMGLYIHEYDGEVRYNDVCISEIDMINARKNLIGYAEQEPLLINDSIYYNLYYNDSSKINGLDSYIETDNILHDNRVVPMDKCVKVLNMEDFIDLNSLSFVIQESNTNISGGEKQKISILKVLHKNPRVMIFDEPTSALDMNTTRSLINYLQKIKGDRIIIIVTHDEYIVSCCDKIVQI